MIDFNTLELHTDPRGFATLWLSREQKNTPKRVVSFGALSAADRPSAKTSRV